MKLKRRVHPGEDIPRCGVLVVRNPRLPSSEPWPDTDIVIWEKVSARKVRLHDGIVAIELKPGQWWVHGELLYYGRTWHEVNSWAARQPQLVDGARVLLVAPGESLT